MKRGFFFFLSYLFLNTLHAQTDPVLMTINKENITRSEFEYIYNKNNSLHNVELNDLNKYADLFINFKLKVDAAKEAGYDTLQSFKNEFEGYKKQIAKTYLIDESINEKAALDYYNKMAQQSYPGKVKIAHIFKYMPQWITATQQEAIKNQMDSISVIIQSNSNIDFNELVNRYSDDKESFWISPLQVPEEFEAVVFKMKVGDISTPFFTPQGIHIVKIIDAVELGSFEEMKESIINMQLARTGINRGIEEAVEKLKKEYNFQLNKDAVSALLAGNTVNDVLFYLNNKPFDSNLFEKFSKGNPSSTQKLLNAFIAKSVLDYEYNNLEMKYPEFKFLMKEYKDGMLLFEISNNQIWERAVEDEAGQKAYFAVNRNNYKWQNPKYKGIVVHGKNKKVAKQVKKLIKNKPIDSWREVILQNMNGQVVLEQGLFAQGDNPSVDALFFKSGSLSPMENYPYTYIFGEKQRGPSSHQEIRGELISDYQNYLDSLWIKQLRREAQIEINYDVLKTVNNH